MLQEPANIASGAIVVENHSNPLGLEHYPAWLGGETYGPWAVFLGAVLVSLIGGWVVARILLFLLRRLSPRATPRFSSFVGRMERPARLLPALLLLQTVAAPLVPGLRGPEVFERVMAVCTIAVVTLVVLAAIAVLQDWLLDRSRIDVADNLSARRRHTQVRIIGRLLRVLVVFLGIALALTTFPAVRQLGNSLLASAGIAGIIIGVAAGPMIGNLIAGLQLAFSEPIRLDDVVVIDGEWGRVEEITATFVVVSIWDERRLVIPLRHFVDKPMVNWTRTSSQILTAVKLKLDYRLPVDAVRAELRRLLESTTLWDKRVAAVHVTGSDERGMEIRLLGSAVDGPTSFELQCLMREQMIRFVRERFPEALPLVRTDSSASSAGATADGITSGATSAG